MPVIVELTELTRAVVAKPVMASFVINPEGFDAE